MIGTMLTDIFIDKSLKSHCPHVWLAGSSSWPNRHGAIFIFWAWLSVVTTRFFYSRASVIMKVKDPMTCMMMWEPSTALAFNMTIASMAILHDCLLGRSAVQCLVLSCIFITNFQLYFKYRKKLHCPNKVSKMGESRVGNGNVEVDNVCW
jgi:hypothetical protein